MIPAGVQRHVAGRWATLAVNGTNRSSQDVEETSIVMIGDDKRIQYAGGSGYPLEPDVRPGCRFESPEIYAGSTADTDDFDSPQGVGSGGSPFSQCGRYANE